MYSAKAAEARKTTRKGNNPAALSVVAAQVLFGTTDKLTIEGAVNKVKNAATLLGNSSYMRVHNNEVILSWLRAMDTDPISDNATDDDQTPAVTPGKTLRICGNRRHSKPCPLAGTDGICRSRDGVRIRHQTKSKILK